MKDVIETEYVRRGTVVGMENNLFMHPLDLITAKAHTVTERLHNAMQWFLDGAHRRLDRRIAALRKDRNG